LPFRARACAWSGLLFLFSDGKNKYKISESQIIF
jgi:hypothetical protein